VRGLEHGGAALGEGRMQPIDLFAAFHGGPNGAVGSSPPVRGGFASSAIPGLAALLALFSGDFFLLASFCLTCRKSRAT